MTEQVQILFLSKREDMKSVRPALAGGLKTLHKDCVLDPSAHADGTDSNANRSTSYFSVLKGRSPRFK
jgi:hypothetical protein